jgi:hypothetical protein
MPQRLRTSKEYSTTMLKSLASPVCLVLAVLAVYVDGRGTAETYQERSQVEIDASGEVMVWSHLPQVGVSDLRTSQNC